jgi:DNA primase
MRYHLYGRADLLRAGDDDPELLSACFGYKLLKGRFLWNLHSFYSTAVLGSIPYVVVVEGFKQAMWMHQAGFSNVVGLMGSHMSTEQATLLLRLGAQIIIFLDNDAPGQSSAKKLEKWLKRQSTDVHRIPYPEGTNGKSPDDLRPEEIRTIFSQRQKHGQ